MTPEQFDFAISQHMVDAFTKNKVALTGFDKTFSALIGNSGPPGLGICSAILDDFQTGINNDSALNPSPSFDWRQDLKTPSLPALDNYFNKSVGTLVSDTETKLRPRVPALV